MKEEVAPKEAKVFGIGLSRTGAMTLNHALELLGYRSHFVKNYAEFERSISDYDAYTHTPLAAIWQELAERFPGSKFILTVREKESWLKSVAAMYAAQKGVTEPENAIVNRRRVYGMEGFDPAHFEAFYARHVSSITDHFAGTPGSLLVFDICGGEGWEKLCPFLGKAEPAEPFPMQNTARATFGRPTKIVRRFLIRQLGARKIKHAVKSLISR